MPGILDDLKGILSPEDFTKLQASPMATRIQRGEEFRQWYDNGVPVEDTTTTAPPLPITTTTPPPAAGQFDLSSLERMLDTRLGKIDERIDAKLGEFATSRGNEFVNSAVKIAVQRADELNRIYHKHAELTGKPFDSVAFNEFLEKPEIKAKGFRTMNDAYDAFISPVVQQQTIDRGIEAGIKAKSGSNVPGTTPMPATNSNIRHFQARGTRAEGGGETGVSRAAAMLDARAQARTEAAS